MISIKGKTLYNLVIDPLPGDTLRIVVLSNLYPPEVLGGYEVLAQDLVTRLRARGHSVWVLTTGKRSTGEVDVERPLRLARRFASEPGRDRARHMLAAAWNRIATESFLRRHGRFDALLVMSQRRMGLEPLRVFQRHDLPAVFTVNDDWPAAYGPVRGRGWTRVVQRVLDHGPWARHTFRGVGVGRVVYLSDSVRDQVREAVPSFPKGIVQAQGVDLDRFVERPFRPVEPPLHLLFVGRLHPTKAPDVAIDGLHALRAAGVEARLTLAGAPVNEVYGQELTRRVRELGLDRHVRWLGQVGRDALPQVYHEADVMLFLNRWNEPQGLTYMEAMACGVPVVAHPMGGARELLEQWPAATIVPMCTGQAVADGVRSLIANPALALRQVVAGRRMLREAASLDHYVHVLEEQLFEAASHRPP